MLPQLCFTSVLVHLVDARLAFEIDNHRLFELQQ